MEQKGDLPTNQENKVERTKKEPEKKEVTKNSLKGAKNLSFTKKYIRLANIQNEPDKILLNTFNFIPLVKLYTAQVKNKKHLIIQKLKIFYFYTNIRVALEKKFLFKNI